MPNNNLQNYFFSSLSDLNPFVVPDGDFGNPVYKLLADPESTPTDPKIAFANVLANLVFQGDGISSSHASCMADTMIMENKIATKCKTDENGVVFRGISYTMVNKGGTIMLDSYQTLRTKGYLGEKVEKGSEDHILKVRF